MNDINLVEHSRVLLAHLYAKRSAIGHAIASLEVLVGEHPDLLRGLPPPPQVVLELDGRTLASAVTKQFEREDEEREKLRARRAAEAKEATVVAEPPPPPPPPPAPKKPAGPPPEPSPAARTKGGKVKPGQYDGAVLRAARDAGELGVTLTDACRAVVGPGKPEKVSSLAGTIHGVLKRLVKAGQLAKSGRYYRLPAQED